MKENLPKHIAIIMDGNGRWAKKRFLPRTAGHHSGIKTARRIIEKAVEKGIQVLTLFVFSSENWRRPKTEVDTILGLFLKALTEDIEKLHKNNVRFKVIGDYQQFPQPIQQAIHQAETLTANNTAMTLVLAANYGGIWDLTHAMQVIAQKVKENELQPEDISAQLISSHLSTANLPEPDLFIRTSGEQRISNFYLWQLSYAELYFTPVYWPDFNAEEFDKALDFFAQRERRYGTTGEQIMEQENA